MGVIIGPLPHGHVNCSRQVVHTHLPGPLSAPTTSGIRCVLQQAGASLWTGLPYANRISQCAHLPPIVWLVATRFGMSGTLGNISSVIRDGYL